MSLTITLTGTGGAQLVPVFGCDCAACRRARCRITIAVARAARW